MFSLLEQMKPGWKKPNISTWANTVRLMRERDGRTDEAIRSLFAKANRDAFWQTVILSPDKLREKFDALEQRLSRRGKSNGSSHARQQDRFAAQQYNPAVQSDI
jgi:hypothetical protein